MTFRSSCSRFFGWKNKFLPKTCAHVSLSSQATGKCPRACRCSAETAHITHFLCNHGSQYTCQTRGLCYALLGSVSVTLLLTGPFATDKRGSNTVTEPLRTTEPQPSTVEKKTPSPVTANTDTSVPVGWRMFGLARGGTAKESFWLSNGNEEKQSIRAFWIKSRNW